MTANQTEDDASISPKKNLRIRPVTIQTILAIVAVVCPLLAASGCFQSEAALCTGESGDATATTGDPDSSNAKWYCPTTMACHPTERCVTVEQIEACDNLPELAACESVTVPTGRCFEGACLTAQCGDGVVDTGHGEECDDGNTVPGDGCSDSCKKEACGNDVLDMGEECDDGNSVAGDGCSARCWLEFCGNGILDPGEVCDDGNNESGDGCHGDCRSAETCGNGLIEAGEACDGLDHGPVECRDMGYVSGDVKCTKWCRLNLEGCSRCGNGWKGPGEECDGDDLGGLSCESLSGGSMSGVLGCTPGCHLDTSSCVPPATCGNFQRDSGEQCDCITGSPYQGEQCTDDRLNHMTCSQFAPTLYGGGLLWCSSTCLFDTSECLPIAHCGNGSAEPWLGEQCDGVDLAGKNCQILGYSDGSLSCSEGCAFDTGECSAPVLCGNGIRDPGEQCEGTDLAGATCETLGFSSGGPLVCTSDCTYDMLSCAVTTVRSEPGFGSWTTSFTPNTFCMCSALNPTCRMLYVGRVVSIEGNLATLEFRKVSLDPPSTNVSYWVVEAQALTSPDCDDLDDYVVRDTGTWSPSQPVLQLVVPIWPTEQYFEGAPCGSTMNLFLITGGGGGFENSKMWFQPQPIVFTKFCS